MRKSNTNGKTRYAYGGGTADFGDRLGWWERTVFPTSNTDVTVKITSKYSKRPDLVAYDYFGTTSLMWLVLQYNNILDINTEFVEGAAITLPTKTRVFSDILRSRSARLTNE